MRCEEVLAKLEDYSYGETGERENAAISAHLEDCEPCDLAYRELLKENDLFFAYRRDLAVPPGMWQRVMAGINAEPISQPNFNASLAANNQTSSKGDDMYQEIFTFLEYEPIWVSFARALTEAWQELKSDPRKFISDLLRGDPSLVRRKRNLRLGATAALICWAFSSICYFGFHYWSPARAADNGDSGLQKIADLSPLVMPEAPDRRGIQHPHGGGGGGDHDPNPVSRGRLPKASLTDPMIVAPSTKPPAIENPSLPVLPIIQVQPELIAKQPENLPLGLSNGVPGPPSNGPGTGGGYGTGSKGGVGSGDGTGLGPGHGYNTGGSEGGIGDGDNIYHQGQSGVTSPQILAKERPKYTEDARRDKVQGTVVLLEVFGADGQIKDVKVIRGLGYGLDEEAIKASYLIKFIPGRKDGKPVNVRARLEFTFSLL